MIEVKRRRKRRSDRTHIVYLITAQDGRRYIGVTGKNHSTINKSLKVRWIKHVSRAFKENHSWALYVAMRELGRDAFRMTVHTIIKTKQAAHTLERKLIDELKPELNTDVRPRAVANEAD